MGADGASVAGERFEWRERLGCRAGTRSGSGKPIRRWAQCWVAALGEASGVQNPTRDEALTRERAQIVLTMLEHGRLRGEDVVL